MKESWVFSKSAFNQYKADSVSLLEKCFEFDWEQIEGKVTYLIKAEVERAKVKSLLNGHFKMLRDAYKLTAGQDASGNMMSIGINGFTHLLNQCTDLVDNKTLNAADLGIAFIAVKAADAKKGKKMIPAGGQLIRYNFLEIFIRLADQKFLKSGITTSWVDAIDKLMTDYLRPVFSKTDSNIWRK